LTIKLNNAIVNKIEIEIEVAHFISILPDASGAKERRRKENVPKG
jgi:hypothetical protein